MLYICNLLCCILQKFAFLLKSSLTEINDEGCAKNKLIENVNGGYKIAKKNIFIVKKDYYLIVIKNSKSFYTSCFYNENQSLSAVCSANNIQNISFEF